MNKTIKVLLIVLAVIAFFVALYFIYKAFTETSTASAPPAQPAGPWAGIISSVGGFLSTIVSGITGKQCDPARPGFQKDGVYNPDKCGVGIPCDPNRPGWNVEGFPDRNC